MENIRIKFSKTGRAKYISHLDLNRFFQRCFKRSGVPVWVTEGFNPHIYLNFLLPLSLGTESISELCDLKFTEEINHEKARDMLNAVLPEGFEILEVKNPVNKPVAITAARYNLVFEETEKEEISSFLALEKIEILKKTKRKEFMVDLKEEMTDISRYEDLDRPAFSVTLSATENRMINPELIVKAMEEHLGRDVFCRITRTKILMENGKEFE